MFGRPKRNNGRRHNHLWCSSTTRLGTMIVDEVRDFHARLPLPTSNIQFVGEALGIFVVWPKRLTMSFVA